VQACDTHRRPADAASGVEHPTQSLRQSLTTMRVAETCATMEAVATRLAERFRSGQQLEANRRRGFNLGKRDGTRCTRVAADPRRFACPAASAHRNKTMTANPPLRSEPKATNITWHKGLVDREQRWRLLGRTGATVWLTGLSASGKSTIASALEYELVTRGVPAYRLDGDNIRHGLNSNLGFSAEDREENIRRIGEVAKLFADSGAVAVTAFISPYRADRDRVRSAHAALGVSFLEVFVSAPLEVCERRDPKGLYRKAREGLIKGFTGIDDPYEPPPQPELVVHTDRDDVDSCVGQILEALAARGVLPQSR
jgi:adenylylsulfate kinase